MTFHEQRRDSEEEYPFDNESAFCQMDPEGALLTVDELNALGQIDPEAALLLIRDFDFEY